VHEVIRDKRSSYKIQDRVITHCGHLYQHVRVREKEDCDTNEVCEEVDVHYIRCIHLKAPTLLFEDMDILEHHFNSYGNTPDHICYKTFKRLFQELEADGFPPLHIIETGTAAHGTASTYLFDAYVKKYGGHLWTVDINPACSEAVKPNVSQNTTVITGDSVAFLRKWVEDHPGEQIDLVYLDSYDLDFANPGPAGVHGLNEFNAILPALKRGSLLLIDDTPILADEFLEEQPRMYISMRHTYDNCGLIPGKGMYVMKHIEAKLLDHWYQVLYRF